jgi:hypothetical protein
LAIGSGTFLGSDGGVPSGLRECEQPPDADFDFHAIERNALFHPSRQFNQTA